MTALEVVNLRLKFPGRSGLQFKDLSLSIQQGEKVLLLGPSGCGKSTLLQVMTGLIPNSIEVPVRYDKITIPQRWGFVFQDPDTQFCMPYVDEELAFVLENLQVPTEQMPDMIKDYLQLVGLQLDDPHTPIQALSQGMKQRLAIAGVLALKPDVLLLDEPTALLDPEGTEQVWETIKQVSRDKTLVIVEHKIDQILDMIDRIVLFNAAGQIIADGPRDEVFATYRTEITNDGIWYPGVWDDYVASSDYPRRDVVQEQKMSKDGTAQSVGSSDKPLIELHKFQAMRGKRCITYVEEAAVGAGEWITVMGHNGAGKSTLLAALMQLIDTKGTYLVRGKPASELRNLTDELAFVFQNPEFQFVTNRTRDEIAYTLQVAGADDRTITAKVDDMLQQFDLTEHQEQHPYQLSMGQKRRLSVASAVVMEQPILLLDEPTFGQDARNTFAILEKLEDWRRRGSTIIMITHDLNIVRYFATSVWHVHEGKVEIIDDPESYVAQHLTAGSQAAMESDGEQDASRRHGLHDEKRHAAARSDDQKELVKQ